MNKRFLALFATLSILATSTFSFVLATQAPNSGVSGETGSGTGDIGGSVPPTSGEIVPNPDPIVSGDISDEESGEVITLVAYGDEIEIDKNTILTTYAWYISAYECNK